MRKGPSRRRGFTLIEMMVAGLVSVLLGAAVLSLLRASYDNQYMLMNQNMVNTAVRQAIDTFADNLRGSQGLTAADVSSLTYSDASGQPVRYWKSGTNLMKTVNGLPAGGTVAVRNVSAVTFVYWTWNGTTWTSATSSASPSSVSALDFAVTLTQNGSSRKISGSVKIRQK
jgi:prepilin-type N-terminal cleavage/methylation domain-containing protein